MFCNSPPNKKTPTTTTLLVAKHSYCAFEQTHYEMMLQHAVCEVLREPCPIRNCDTCRGDTRVDAAPGASAAAGKGGQNVSRVFQGVDRRPIGGGGAASRRGGWTAGDNDDEMEDNYFVDDVEIFDDEDDNAAFEVLRRLQRSDGGRDVGDAPSRAPRKSRLQRRQEEAEEEEKRRRMRQRRDSSAPPASSSSRPKTAKSQYSLKSNLSRSRPASFSSSKGERRTPLKANYFDDDVDDDDDDDVRSAMSGNRRRRRRSVSPTGTEVSEMRVSVASKRNPADSRSVISGVSSAKSGRSASKNSDGGREKRRKSAASLLSRQLSSGSLRGGGSGGAGVRRGSRPASSKHFLGRVTSAGVRSSAGSRN